MAGDTEGADEASLPRPDSDASASDAEAAGARPCMPCRGTGKVISNLGGTRSEVVCPWCGGNGVREAGVDAQAPWRERGASAADTGTEASSAG